MVVWRVVDTAEAVFEVDDYEDYVAIQSEAAIRNMATSYPYDDHEGESITLRGSANEIGEILKVEVQERLGKAGVEVLESANQPPRLRAGNRQRHAAAAASFGDCGGAGQDRRGRGGHGRSRTATAVSATNSRPGCPQQGDAGEQSPGHSL